jgi:ectoine hydroxylase-related dioxygenase (phytanoyl-CoA dioxygenase family)
MITALPAMELYAHDKPLVKTPDRMDWLIPSDPDAPMAELQRQYRTQGYLWLKGILPRERVLKFRETYFKALEPFGLLKAGTPPVEGIAAPEPPPMSAALRKLETQAVKWAVFEAFCFMPEIVEFYETFLGGHTYLHKRKLIRRTQPGTSWATPAHYDLVYLRGGTDKSLCTSWIPIGDIPVEMGGLVYLEGSDAAGRKYEAEFTRLNTDLSPEERINAYNKNMEEGGWLSPDLPALADKLSLRWLIANYEAGDMVVHSPYMIHAATNNQDTQGRMRLSADIRYQLVDDEIDQRWRFDWYPGDNL